MEMVCALRLLPLTSVGVRALERSPAAQGASKPKSMQEVKDRLGTKFASGSVEVVFKINAIDGKTGSPSIEDAYAW